MSSKNILKRLYAQNGGWASDEALDAAHRIEELEAKLATCRKYRDAYAECDRISTHALRKAVEALTKIAGHGYGLQGLLEDGASDSEIADYWMREVGRRQAIAKAILAELSSVSCANLKGETDE